jgi:hypothetical protein
MIFRKLNYSITFEITKVEITFENNFVSDLVLSVPKTVPISSIKTETDEIQSLKQLDIDSVIFGKSLVDQGDSIWVPLLLNPFFSTGDINGKKLTIYFQANLESPDQIAIYGNVKGGIEEVPLSIVHRCSGIVELKAGAKNKLNIYNDKRTNLVYFYGTYLENKITSFKLSLNETELFDLDPKAIRINQFYRGHSTDAMIIYFGKDHLEGLDPGQLEFEIEYLAEKDATINATCYSI